MLGKNPANVFNHIIAYSYYDCMSGGMSRIAIKICRQMIHHFKCDLNVNVYPGKSDKEWHTLNDWLEETKASDDDDNILPNAFIAGLLKDY